MGQLYHSECRADIACDDKQLQHQGVFLEEVQEQVQGEQAEAGLLEMSYLHQVDEEQVG